MSEREIQILSDCAKRQEERCRSASKGGLARSTKGDRAYRAGLWKAAEMVKDIIKHNPFMSGGQVYDELLRRLTDENRRG